MFKPKSSLIQELQLRGYIHQCTNIEELDQLAAKRKLVAYIGFDCTAESLHVGSLIQLMLIRILQKTGHQVVVLLGGGTSKIGDPSGKDKSRQLLNDKEIKNNSQNIKKNIEKFTIKNSNVKKVKFLDNSIWLDTVNYINFLRTYGKNVSVNKMLSMDSVSERLKREQPLSFLEFNYMIIQAYDFVELNKLKLYSRFKHVANIRTVAGQGAIDPLHSTDQINIVDLVLKYRISKNFMFESKILNLFNDKSIVASRPAGVRPNMPRNINFSFLFDF